MINTRAQYDYATKHLKSRATMMYEVIEPLHITARA